MYKNCYKLHGSQANLSLLLLQQQPVSGTGSLVYLTWAVTEFIIMESYNTTAGLSAGDKTLQPDCLPVLVAVGLSCGVCGGPDVA